MLEKEFEIASLLAGYRAGILTDEEKKRLQYWVGSSAEAGTLFKKMEDPAAFRELLTLARRYDRQGAWNKIERRISRRSLPNMRKYMAYAALFSLPLVVCYLLLQQNVEDSRPSSSSYTAHHTEIRPGTTKAVLTLGDGTIVDLEKQKAFEMKEKEGTKIFKDSASLNYEKGNASPSAGKTVYNRIDIPRGGEYTLTLSDGSRIHLNAMSSLRYPVTFNGNERVVELEGEAYFEVSKNVKPFIVKTGDIQVKVLGTEFNIQSYKDEEFIGTTLVKGSVCMTEKGKAPVYLKPSQQANFCKKSKEITVETVDVSVYTAWKDGYFRFKDWRLEDIMTYLGRWYDIHVFYARPGLQDLRFGCSISRYGDIGPILSLLQETGKVSAEIKGNTIVFR